jgi:hypothetical protein
MAIMKVIIPLFQLMCRRPSLVDTGIFHLNDLVAIHYFQIEVRHKITQFIL